MKKRGILNAQLAGYVAALGHKDLFLIGDAGMPIPSNVPIVDLVLCGGVPTFEQVMNAILDEVEVEHYVLANEIYEKNPRLLKYIQEAMPEITNETMPHIEFKEFTKHVKFAIRTGEFTPYPNVILRAGVAFPA
ncbi:MAG: D-ribose pyranase [Lachnospiraceae bacterium]|nr:D-ribose pyranase [Lachnospiraceae bacterium]